MRVFLAGATGALGRALVPQLIEAGHDVIGTTRTRAHLEPLAEAGAEPVLMDGLDADAVRTAVTAAEPDVVIHQLTALKSLDFRKFEEAFAVTNRLRVEGTDSLLQAARDAGAKRFITQSYSGWTNPRTGGWIKSESDGLDPHPVAAAREALEAMRHVEKVVPEAPGLTGIVLRYGGFYGGGTGLSKDGDMMDLVRKRQFPVVGGGQGVWSLIHIEDAASATVQAIDHGEAGVYNIVDDEPAPAAEWLPALAKAIGAKPPRRLPAWLGRLAAGEQVVMMMTQSRGSSNAKAKRELDWKPRYASWRQGFVSGLG